jgi:hypothetical protein
MEVFVLNEKHEVRGNPDSGFVHYLESARFSGSENARIGELVDVFGAKT